MHPFQNSFKQSQYHCAHHVNSKETIFVTFITFKLCLLSNYYFCLLNMLHLTLPNASFHSIEIFVDFVSIIHLSCPLSCGKYCFGLFFCKHYIFMSSNKFKCISMGIECQFKFVHDFVILLIYRYIRMEIIFIRTVL